MAIQKMASTSSLQIEVQSGQDSNGNATFKKKSFSGVRTDADLQNVFDVATAIKGVLDAENSKLVAQA